MEQQWKIETGAMTATEGRDERAGMHSRSAHGKGAASFESEE